MAAKKTSTPKKSKTAPRLRDRIKELRRVKASTLINNEKNWRRHPEEQKGAMNSMLEQIGFTGALVARETKAGLELIDGHLRKELAGEDEVPVLVVDLTDDEADLMLATFDPLSDLAVMDADALRSLLEDTEEVDDNAFLRQLMAEVDEDVSKQTKKGDKEKEIEGMTLEPHEHYDYLVVFAQTTHEWNSLLEKIGLTSDPRRKKMGTARAIRAIRLLEKLNSKS